MIKIEASFIKKSMALEHHHIVINNLIGLNYCLCDFSCSCDFKHIHMILIMFSSWVIICL